MHVHVSLCARHVAQVYTRHYVVWSAVRPGALSHIRHVTRGDGRELYLLDGFLLPVFYILGYFDVFFGHLETEMKTWVNMDERNIAGQYVGQSVVQYVV